MIQTTGVWCVVLLNSSRGKCALYTVHMCAFHFFSHSINFSNFGKLNFFLGKKAAADGRNAVYPNLDFCKVCMSGF